MTDSALVIEHFGRKGMKWGEHIFGRKPSAKTSSSSDDAASATALKAKVKSAGGVHTLSNDELKQLTTRLNLEKQYKDLTSKDTKKGQDIVTDMLKQAGKQQAQIYINKGAQKGAEALTKKILKATAKTAVKTAVATVS